MQYTRDLGNTERVEVLKGPAAVLYGRGSTGGIVNRVSKKPQKGLESSVSAQVGSFDSRRLAADLNGEAGEQVQVRLNLAQEDKDSFRNGVTSKRTLLAPPSTGDQRQAELAGAVRAQRARPHPGSRHPRRQR